MLLTPYYGETNGQWHIHSPNQSKKKKKCSSFKIEWLSEYVRTEEQEVRLGEIFSFLSEKGLLCKTCCEAKVASEFSEGKVWTEWKLDYLKRHIQHESHLNAVGIVRRRKMGMGIGTSLQESAKDREERAVTQKEIRHRAS